MYITDVEHGAVHRVDPDGNRVTVIRSPRIRWADALSFGPEQTIYLADSALADVMLMPREHIEAAAPYHVYRFEVDVAGVPGQ